VEEHGLDLGNKDGRQNDVVCVGRESVSRREKKEDIGGNRRGKRTEDGVGPVLSSVKVVTELKIDWRKEKVSGQEGEKGEKWREAHREGKEEEAERKEKDVPSAIARPIKMWLKRRVHP
jgi:hypothetical protein